jgi:predicted Zn-dependent protease
MIAAAVAVTAIAPEARALGLVRDTEIEATIRTYAVPLFNAAGLDAGSVRTYLVNSRELNAFVAGGQNLFLNTGLLIRAENASQVIGVIAHETGHVSGGHLARLQDALRSARATAIAAMVLGGLAGLAAGRADAGVAAMMGGQQVAERSLLSYSRTQEASADQAGMGFLDRVGWSSRGLLEFFEVLSNQEFMAYDRQSPYVRSHPLTRDRIEAVRAHLQRAPAATTAPLPAIFEQMHQRTRAKLRGFLSPPGDTLALYKESDRSVPARYARAIAFHRQARLPDALRLIDGLIAESPRDPYFHELKGQILFESGRVREAAASYDTAVQLMPSAPLLRVGLAQAELELNDPKLLQKAKANLNEATRQDMDYALAWRLLAIAHGREGNIGMAAIALAEQALLENRMRDARQQASRAEQLLARGSPGWLRAQDIKDAAREKQ